MRKRAESVRRHQGTHADAAYQMILDQILRGRLPLGADVSRRRMAEQLGLGLQPVTEALLRLEVDGIVESQPRIGTRVRVPTPSAVRGHYIVREALESQSARLFAENASRSHRTEVECLAIRLDEDFRGGDRFEPGTGDWEEYWFRVHSDHTRFHLRIAECTGCEPLVEAMKKNQILIFNWLYDIASGPRAVPQQWHSELAAALNTRRAEVADAAMRHHIRRGQEEILQRLASYPKLAQPARSVEPAATPVSTS